MSRPDRHLVALLLLGVALALGTGDAAAGSSPPGATARCADGTYSFAKHHRGACSHHGGVAVWLDGSGGTSPRTPAGTVVVGRTLLLAPRTLAAGCKRGDLPDRRCSPGARYSGLTRAVICAAGFTTKTIRNVPQSEKNAVEAEYGLPPRAYGSSLEIDHIVSLELGGSNDIANLYPEAAPGFHAKDRLENRLHALVCSGALGLDAAQRQIAANWVTLYERTFGTSAT